MRTIRTRLLDYIETLKLDNDHCLDLARKLIDEDNNKKAILYITQARNLRDVIAKLKEIAEEE